MHPLRAAERIGQLPASQDDNWQTDAACLKAGDCMLIEAGSTNDTPFSITTVPGPGGLRGAPVVGSGKSLTPCARMHSAAARNSRFVAAVLAFDAAGFPPGSSLEHAFSAAWNDGDPTMIPVSASEKLPKLSGSGKLVTPCERMHAEYLTAVARTEARLVLLLDLLEEPQSASANAATRRDRPTSMRLE
jgi:hypothetical protein